MAREISSLPGMTRRAPGPADSVKPLLPLVKTTPLFDRKVLLIATASISDTNIFNNGLYQNCFIIYKLAEAIGWLPIFVVNKQPASLSEIPEILHHCRITEVENILRQPPAVSMYLEIGMSMSPQLRRHMKMLGARSTKLYLGNILNIDIETPMCFPGMFFNHHVVGEQDEIWVSPHYAQHSEYATIINKLDPSEKSQRIAPYIWDPCILTDNGRRNIQWRPRRSNERACIVIMEPNISFQKTCIVPLLLVEEYARKHPEKDFDVHLLNSDRLVVTDYFKTVIEPSLTLVKQGRLKFSGRHDVITIMKNFPHATAICHHVNNEFNYMALEFIWAGFPLVHNSEVWKDFAYYYPENDTKVGSSVLKEALHNHTERLEAYKGHGRALAWRHSIYNPDVQSAWKDLLENAMNQTR